MKIRKIAFTIAGLFSAAPAFASLPPNANPGAETESTNLLYVSLLQPGISNEMLNSSINYLQQQNCEFVDEFADQKGKVILEFSCLDRHTVTLPSGFLHLANENDHNKR